MRATLCLLLCSALFWTLGQSSLAAGRMDDDLAAFQAARKLEQADQPQKAFLAYCAIPGGQHLAVRIGRAKPVEYLALLQSHEGKIPAPLAKVVEGDLRLAAGERPAALACYRGAAKMAATKDDQDWATGHIPADAYIVEPARRPEGFGFDYRAAEPLTTGPGSHRDNWLIRRFISLEAWDDAAAEFARVWEIHRRKSRPHRVLVPVRMEGDKLVSEERLVRPFGFDSEGLQFALDYAFFLRKINRPQQALAVVEEPLLAIDMDRNTNPRIFEPLKAGQAAEFPLLKHSGGRFPWANGGVSRKEFVRLAYGVFKEAGKQQDLIAALEKKIAAGENRLRRVLARVRFHEGKPDEALALELAYIQRADFDPLTAACRQGLVYEEAGRPAEAAAAYERARALPFKPPKLPDPDEMIAESMSQVAMPATAGAYGQPASPAGILNKLERLYGGLGKPERAFELALQQMEAEPATIADVDALEQAAARAEALGRPAAFRDWAKRQVARTKDPGTLAALHWTLTDYQACTRDVAEQSKHADHRWGSYSLEMWLDRFRKVGKAEARSLLTAVVEADPKNARARMELLDLTDRIDGREAIAAFESLLETDAGFVFERGKGDFNRTHFRNYFDLAYRLLRLYQKFGERAKLVALGMRIAGGEKPFGAWWKEDPRQYEYRDENGWPEDVNACLALLVDEAGADALARLDNLWRPLPDCPAKRQLARRLAHGLPAAGQPRSGSAADIGWQHLPAGVRLIAASANVLALARDEKYVYVGHPWGVEVYDPAGEAVTRVALGEPVEALAAAGGAVWAGTPRGLFKIEPGDWAVAHLWLHGDVEPQNRYSRPFPGPGDYWFDNKVYSLVPDGDELWIGLHRNIQRLNTRTMTLRAFSLRELHSESWIGVSQIVPDGEYVWAGNGSTLLRYDRAADSWDRVQFGKRPLGLIGLVDGKVLGNVWLDDRLRNRPAIIDRQTLKVTPLLIDAARGDAGRLINTAFSFYGKRKGRIVLAAEGLYAMDEAAARIRPLFTDGGFPEVFRELDTVLPEGFARGMPRWMPAGRPGDVLIRDLSYGNDVVLASTAGPLVAGRRWEAELFGGLMDSAISHENRGEAGLWFFSPQRTAKSPVIPPLGGNRDGGPPEGNTTLQLPPKGGTTSARGTARLVSRSPRGDRIGADAVQAVVDDPGGKRRWLVTDDGLAVSDADDRVTATLDREDGLLANRLTGGARLDGRLYFSAAWGDHGGGLAVFNPQTSVLTGRFIADGLATDKLASIRQVGNRLKLLYGVEYGRGGDYRYRQFPPGVYDPRTGAVESGGPPRKFDDRGLRQADPSSRAGLPQVMPYLGGRCLGKQSLGGKSYLCGERGLVILSSDQRPEPSPPELAVSLIVDPDARLQAEARQAQVAIDSPDDLKTALGATNPYLRARALAKVLGMPQPTQRAFLPAIATAVRDPHLRPRATAVALLSMIDDDAAIAAIKPAAGDRDPYIRAVAALALVRHGQSLPLDQVKEMLDSQFGNFPFDAESSVGVLVDRQRVEEALAPHADAAIFRLFLENPPSRQAYDNGSKVFPQLGASLRRHPEAAAELLAAYDDGPYGAVRRDFARDVFQSAGRPMLPLLYEALRSKDRVLRSNAARACGAIGDTAAIKHLIRALDLESGLSRASIVWALGELQAREALPRLAALYIDARNDEKHRRGAGFLAAQSAAQFQSQMTVLHTAADSAEQWDELKAEGLPQPIDPRRNEPLLEARTILEAVARIGPEAAQDFYRKLAAEADRDAREEAARRLGEVPAAKARNEPILRNLLADTDQGVRMAAAVSLLLLGETDARKPILAWLQSPDRWPPGAIVRELERVKEGRLLVFARAAVEKLAAENDNTYDSAPLARQLLGRIPRAE